MNKGLGIGWKARIKAMRLAVLLLGAGLSMGAHAFDQLNGVWRAVCKPDGRSQIEIEVRRDLNGQLGLLMVVSESRAAETGRYWSVRAGPWEHTYGLKWCPSKGAWDCDEAIDGELRLAKGDGDTVEGEIGVLLRSGSRINERFRAAHERGSRNGC